MGENNPITDCCNLLDHYRNESFDTNLLMLNKSDICQNICDISEHIKNQSDLLFVESHRLICIMKSISQLDKSKLSIKQFNEMCATNQFIYLIVKSLLEPIILKMFDVISFNYEYVLSQQKKYQKKLLSQTIS
ncbi:hypothetical protein AB837_00469 [bacterium AB1]|nr:hypothetical protein AB837_00469 [bacterium AB1]